MRTRGAAQRAPLVVDCGRHCLPHAPRKDSGSRHGRKRANVVECDHHPLGGTGRGAPHRRDRPCRRHGQSPRRHRLGGRRPARRLFPKHDRLDPDSGRRLDGRRDVVPMESAVRTGLPVACAGSAGVGDAAADDRLCRAGGDDRYLRGVGALHRGIHALAGQVPVVDRGAGEPRCTDGDFSVVRTVVPHPPAEGADRAAARVLARAKNKRDRRNELESGWKRSAT